jgi:exonuclease III
MVFLKKNNNLNILKKCTNIIQWNVRSLPTRLPSLQHLLSDHKCSIALFSETWLLPSRPLTIPQFKTYISDSYDGYVGVAIAVHISLKYKQIPLDVATRNSFTHHKIDIIGIEVHLVNSHPPLKFWSCYIPSNSNVPSNLRRELFNLISYNTLLGGDFNAFHPA